MKLFDNPFSPFARKVRLVLDWKGLAYEAIDGLEPGSMLALEAASLGGHVAAHERRAAQIAVPARIDPA